jgi:hypothetical protein
MTISRRFNIGGIMKCTCCSQDVAEDKAVFYLQMFLCKSCASSARQLKDKMRSELENVLATQNDAFRKFLVDNELPKNDVTLLSSQELLALAISVYRYSKEVPCVSSSSSR